MNLATERIRALNDELRRNLPNGHPSSLLVSLPSAPKPSLESSRLSQSTTTFATPTILMKSTTSAQSKPMAR